MVWGIGCGEEVGESCNAPYNLHATTYTLNPKP